eukprot:gene15767-18743_t
MYKYISEPTAVPSRPAPQTVISDFIAYIWVQRSSGNTINVAQNDGQDKEEEDDKLVAPKLPFHKLYWLFIQFGLSAWGGPVAQIDLLKQTLVVEQRWTNISRFNKVLAVYQVLPGPEATELCCFFGYLSRGRIGSAIAGLGFITPGFIFMLVASFLYERYGLTNPHVLASFRAIQPPVCALIFRAVHRLGQTSFTNHKTDQIDWVLATIGLISFITVVLNISFFIVLVFLGIVNVLCKKRLWIVAGVQMAAGLAAYIIYVVFKGVPPNASIGGGLVANRSLGGLFVLGLLAGLLTFGGAYTAVPFVQQDVVESGKWMTNAQFLDGIAIASILPTPLVMFATFIGYMGNKFPGAILMTIGIFLPAFSFTIIGHNLFEKLVHNPTLSSFFDGVTASVIGLVFATAFDFLRTSVTDVLTCALFLGSLATLYHFKNKFTSMIMIAVCAVAGQILFCPNNQCIAFTMVQ